MRIQAADHYISKSRGLGISSIRESGKLCIIQASLSDIGLKSSYSQGRISEPLLSVDEQRRNEPPVTNA